MLPALVFRTLRSANKRSITALRVVANYHEMRHTSQHEHA